MAKFMVGCMFVALILTYWIGYSDGAVMACVR